MAGCLISMVAYTQADVDNAKIKEEQRKEKNRNRKIRKEQARNSTYIIK
jgi:hypothetical protein